MNRSRTEIEGVPAIVWGAASNRVWLCVHGQGGRKEDAEGFAALAEEHGAQAVSLDLPEHGERVGQDALCVPWQAVPEIQSAAAWARSRWRWLGLRGESLGAWFGMLALGVQPPDRALFVSPVLDMAALISDMMSWAGVTADRLEREGEIPTDLGQTLSWKYFCYAKEHAVRRWECPTEILYAREDALIRRETVDRFAARFHAGLTVTEGEHWFHTPEQIDTLTEWTRVCLTKEEGRKRHETAKSDI